MSGTRRGGNSATPAAALRARERAPREAELKKMSMKALRDILRASGQTPKASTKKVVLISRILEGEF